MNVTLPSNLQMLLGLYAVLLPMLLYVLWSTLALWDLFKRETLSNGAVWMWSLMIFLVPIAGALAYLLLGGAGIAPRSKLVAVGGGAALYGIVLLVGVAVGGIS
jgi:hypothetical protein